MVTKRYSVTRVKLAGLYKQLMTKKINIQFNKQNLKYCSLP